MLFQLMFLKGISHLAFKEDAAHALIISDWYVLAADYHGIRDSCIFEHRYETRTLISASSLTL